MLKIDTVSNECKSYDYAKIIEIDNKLINGTRYSALFTPFLVSVTWNLGLGKTKNFVYCVNTLSPSGNTIQLRLVDELSDAQALASDCLWVYNTQDTKFEIYFKGQFNGGYTCNVSVIGNDLPVVKILQNPVFNVTSFNYPINNSSINRTTLGYRGDYSSWSIDVDDTNIISGVYNLNNDSIRGLGPTYGSFHQYGNYNKTQVVYDTLRHYVAFRSWNKVWYPWVVVGGDYIYLVEGLYSSALDKDQSFLVRNGSMSSIRLAFTPTADVPAYTNIFNVPSYVGTKNKIRNYISNGNYYIEGTKVFNVNLIQANKVTVIEGMYRNN